MNTRRRGAVMVEYAVILFLIAVPMVIGFGLGANELKASYVQGRKHMTEARP